jgi:hypothetical protein
MQSNTESMEESRIVRKKTKLNKKNKNFKEDQDDIYLETEVRGILGSEDDNYGK